MDQRPSVTAPAGCKSPFCFYPGVTLSGTQNLPPSGIVNFVLQMRNLRLWDTMIPSCMGGSSHRNSAKSFSFLPCNWRVVVFLLMRYGAEIYQLKGSWDGEVGGHKFISKQGESRKSKITLLSWWYYLSGGRHLFHSINPWKTALLWAFFKNNNNSDIRSTDSKEPPRSFSMCDPNLFILWISLLFPKWMSFRIQ